MQGLFRSAWRNVLPIWASAPSMEKKLVLAGSATSPTGLPRQIMVLPVVAQLIAANFSKLRLPRCHSSNSR